PRATLAGLTAEHLSLFLVHLSLLELIEELRLQGTEPALRTDLGDQGSETAVERDKGRAHGHAGADIPGLRRRCRRLARGRRGRGGGRGRGGRGGGAGGGGGGGAAGGGGGRGWGGGGGRCRGGTQTCCCPARWRWRSGSCPRGATGRTSP